MVPFLNVLQLTCSELLLKLIKIFFLFGPGFWHLAGPGRELGSDFRQAGGRAGSGPVRVLGTDRYLILKFI